MILISSKCNTVKLVSSGICLVCDLGVIYLCDQQNNNVRMNDWTGVLFPEPLVITRNKPRREAWGFFCLHRIWNLRAASLILLFYIPLLFFCLVLSLSLSYPFLLLAHSPDLFFTNLHFLKGRLFCVALAFCLFEWLGEEYFSWYVQHNYAAIWH